MSLYALSDVFEILIFFVFLLVLCLCWFALCVDQQCRHRGTLPPSKRNDRSSTSGDRSDKTADLIKRAG